jgi:hypothetical protein
LYHSRALWWISPYSTDTLIHKEDRDLMKPPRRDEERLTEDEIARAHLGDRGVKGEPFPIKEMTPERKKKTPLRELDPGHTA